MEMEQSVNKSLDQVVSAIWTLDLDPIKFKLMDPEEGHGWSRDLADRNEIEYKRFLTLLAKYPGMVIVPSKDVDKFWHAHILDTYKYAEDCAQVFGYFLHHFPYFGMRGSEDAAQLAAAARITHDLLRKEFGAPETGQSAGFCGVTNDVSFPGAPNAASFCGATNDASFCGATTLERNRPPDAQAGFCGATNARPSDHAEFSKHDADNALRPDWRPGDSQVRQAC